MHEMSIALNIISIVTDEMEKNNAGVLRSVRLKIGKMSAVVPDSLSFCFEIITKDTPLDEARLVIDIAPLMGFCRICEEEFEMDCYSFSCPNCGCTGIETISGHELSIVEIEVD